MNGAVEVDRNAERGQSPVRKDSLFLQANQQEQVPRRKTAADINSDFFPTQLKFPEIEVTNPSTKNKNGKAPQASNNLVNKKAKTPELTTSPEKFNKKLKIGINTEAKSDKKETKTQGNKLKTVSLNISEQEELENSIQENKLTRDDRDRREDLNFKRIRGDLNNRRNYIIREKGEVRPISLDEIKKNELKIDERFDLLRNVNQAKLERFEQFDFGSTRNFEKANNSLKRRLISRIQSLHHIEDKKKISFIATSEQNSFLELRKATANLKNEPEVFVDLAHKFAVTHTPSASQLKNLLSLSLKAQTPKVFSRNCSMDLDSLSIANNSTALSSAVKGRLGIQSQPSSPVIQRSITAEKNMHKATPQSRGISTAITKVRSTANSWRNMTATSSLWTNHQEEKRSKMKLQKAITTRDFRLYFALSHKKHLPSFNKEELAFEVTNSKKV